MWALEVQRAPWADSQRRNTSPALCEGPDPMGNTWRSSGPQGFLPPVPTLPPPIQGEALDSWYLLDTVLGDGEADVKAGFTILGRLGGPVG